MKLVEPKIKVYGAARIIRKLRRRLPLATKLAMDMGTDAAATWLLRKVKEKAPVLKDKEQLISKPWLKEGFLKESIVKEKIRVPRGAGYIVGCLAPYAPHVEYGVSHPGVATKLVWFVKEGRTIVRLGGISPHEIPAQPFFRPALLAFEKRFLAVMGRYWRRHIRPLLFGGASR